MLTVDIAINGKSIGKMTIVNDGKHHGRPDYGSYDVEAEIGGVTYGAHVPVHYRPSGALWLVHKAMRLMAIAAGNDPKGGEQWKAS